MPIIRFGGKIFKWPNSEEGVRKAVDFAKRVRLTKSLILSDIPEESALRRLAAKLLKSKGPVATNDDERKGRTFNSNK